MLSVSFLVFSALLIGLPFFDSDSSQQDDGPGDADPDDALVIEGTSGDDLLEGSAEDETLEGLFGEDTLMGGAGDDLLVSGSAQAFSEDYSPRHDGGLFQTLDIAADVLDGGEGDDTLYVGPGGEATGGEGADLFRTFLLDPITLANGVGAGAVGDEDVTFQEPIHITDFEPGEDQLWIGTVAEFDPDDPSFAELDYDEETDQTSVIWEGNEVALLDGQHEDLTIVYSNVYVPEHEGGAAGDYTVLADGTLVSGPEAEQAAFASADIVIGGYESPNSFIDPYLGQGYRTA